ncbi:GntR family transcriptional regulator [Pueribacillus sp. YX66]|uniref:GntR family transcriptional regulator n=1 Tax=Pueribacillus sp. YX66 TaxID=3229242 RepID=UPI00358D8D3E
MDSFRLSDLDRATLQYKVTSKLREAILKGEFNMGDRLIQEEWAEKLGVSRMPIREALRQLEVEGLVKIEPRRGAIVTPISVEDIEEIYQLRALLEGKAVVMSLPNLDDDDIQELESLHLKMTKLRADDSDVEKYMELNNKFHQILRSGCPWRRIHGIIDTLWKGIPPYTPSLLINHVNDSMKEHEQMVQYVKENEPEKLEAVVKKHILRTRNNLIKVVSRQDENS